MSPFLYPEKPPSDTRFRMAHRQLDVASNKPRTGSAIAPRPATDTYDIGGPAPICWKTVDSLVSRLASCPAGLAVEFLKTPPTTVFANDDYLTTYRLIIDPLSWGIIPINENGTSYDVPHAIIRSCRNKVGFCTPFIEDMPGLSFSTLPVAGNLDAFEQNRSSVTFNSSVKFEPGSYTNIAHLQLWGRDATGEDAKYDIAAAFVRDVLPARKILAVAPAVQYAMAAVVALSCLFLVLCLACLFYWRSHKIMRFSQVNILMYMTVAGFVALCGVPLAGVSTQEACSLRPWMTIIPLNFMFALLFGKTWRIFRLMNNKQLKAVRIKETYVLYVAFLLTLPEILIHGFYFLIFPPRLQLTRVINDYTFLYECTGGSPAKNIFDGLHLAYATIILLLGCYVANKSASLTTLFNEGKYILFAIYTCFVLSIIIVPASFAVATDPQTGFILRTLGVTLAVTGTISAIILPKIKLILSGVDLSLDDGKTNTTNPTKSNNTQSGPKATSSNTVAAPTPAGSASNIIQVKNRVPSAVMETLGGALTAGNKVVDRQKQGFALQRPDWDACVDHVRSLNETLHRCVFSSNAQGAANDVAGGSSAKVAPSNI